MVDREIRNVIRTAQTLAEGKNEGVTKDHAIKIIRMIQEFQKDIEVMKSCDQDYPKITGNEKSQRIS